MWKFRSNNEDMRAKSSSSKSHTQLKKLTKPIKLDAGCTDRNPSISQTEKVVPLRSGSNNFQKYQDALHIKVNPSICPKIKVSIFDTDIIALLDSGASISVLNSTKLIEKHGLKLLKATVVVSTADNTEHECLGYANVPYTFAGNTKVIPTIIVPQISKTLILGMDFWQAFGIKPMIKFENQLSDVDLLDVNGQPMINFVSPEHHLQTTPMNTEPEICLKICSLELTENETVMSHKAKLEEDESLELPSLELPNNPELEIEIIETEHELSESERGQLKEALKCFQWTSENKLGRTNLIEHEIEIIEGAKMRDLPMYRYSPSVWESIEKELERYEKLDVIEECTSEFASPLVPVKKSNGNIRVCLDSRKINSITKKDAYPMRNMNEIFHRLQKSKFFSIIDLKDAYFQVPLKENSRNYTAFRTPKGLFRFKVVPFGLKNAPFTMSRLMNKAIGFDLEPHVFIYLDDIVIATETLEEHFRLLKEVAKRLARAGLTISVQKSRFCRRQVKYLGYLLTENGLSIDGSKLEPILNYPRPKSIRDVRRLMGLMGFYQKFISNYSHITTPITDLLKKSRKFVWTQEAEHALDELKAVLTSAPVLANPRYDLPFVIETDASQLAVGAALLQDHPEGRRIIAYFSKKLSSTQRKYAATEKECLAVLLAVENFRHYIEGTSFKVITDAKSITWLFTITAANGNSRLLRWALKLQSYDFSITYRKGKDNVLADCLSRIETVQVRDDEYLNLRSQITQNPENFKDFKIVGNKVFKLVQNTEKVEDKRFIWKYYPPKEDRTEIIKSIHDPAHLGYDKTILKLKEKYFWPGMAMQTKQFCKTCIPCKTSKSSNVNNVPPMGSQKQNCQHPWQFLTLDYLGPFPPSGKARSTCLLVATDVFTKFVLVQPFRQATASSLVNFLEQSIFLLFGVPQTILTDNGSQFTSNLFKNLMEHYGVTHWLTPSYHPQVNNSERVNRVITAAIRATIKSNHKSWADNVQSIANAIRNASHESTKHTPYFLTFGRNMISDGREYENIEDTNGKEHTISPEQRTQLYEQVRKNLHDAYMKQSKYYNLRSSSKAPKYQVGERVLKKSTFLSDKGRDFCAKLAPRYTQAYVTKVIGDSYELADDTGKRIGIFHATFLKKF